SHVPMGITARIASLLGLGIVFAWTLSESVLSAATLDCDLEAYQPIPGLTANIETDYLTVRWDGESGQKLRAQFGIQDGVPTVRELSIQPQGGSWRVLGRNLTPELGVTTGVRRTNHGLPEENRWDVFWDVPLNRPGDIR